MEDHYGLPDLRHHLAAAGRSFYPSIPQPPDFQAGHPYYVLNFCPDGGGFPSAEAGGGLAGYGAESGGGGRWPRQETLTLLEVRSRMDGRFKEANQKGPLWDEVSRIMYDEYGYQRTGKKCREKFENLYKYYKKTKGGKSGRPDGKHYRFFRQLEALYGENNNNNNNNNNNSSASVSDQTTFAGPNFPYNIFPENNTNSFIPNESHAISISNNSSDFDTIITSDDESAEPNRSKKIMMMKSFKAKIKDSVDTQMKKMVEKQEAWMEKLMRRIEENEKERNLREEQWRKEDAERVEREQRIWAREKAWILDRDAALIEAFGKMAGKARQEDWESGNVASSTWDCIGDCFVKCGKKRMGPFHVGPIVGGQGPDRGINMARENVSNEGCFRYFSGDVKY
ncbi:homeodomain-like superfamily protein [Striga asiatica]|uniref:Homeodomain-like superfamily protein n=1 Tax=Striga asiatica TaxID=4170 RepID=A0A5A7PN17_STRAF|nr:homeodomain-like superfamily protein [Striga asiatica]